VERCALFLNGIDARINLPDLGLSILSATFLAQFGLALQPNRLASTD